jgi:large subunit ribosomal protein L17
MRHRKSGRKFGRKSAPRRALKRSIVTSLFSHGRIETTLPRAKEYRSAAEKLITLARKGLAAKDAGDSVAWLNYYRRVIAELGGTKFAENIAKSLFADIAPQFRDTPGGYTRVIRMARGRLGDNAPRAIFELVGYTPVTTVEGEGEGEDTDESTDAAGTDAEKT